MGKAPPAVVAGLGHEVIVEAGGLAALKPDRDVTSSSPVRTAVTLDLSSL